MLPVLVYFNSFFLDKAMKDEDVLFVENDSVLHDNLDKFIL